MKMTVEMSDLNACEARDGYRWGGIASLLLAIGYVAIIPLFAWVGAPPATGEAWFRYLPGKTTAWWAIIWLSVVTDLLYLPVAWALWTALHKSGTKLMPASVACFHLFVVLDLAVTWTHHASLLALFQNYSSAADEAHRAAYQAAAEYACLDLCDAAADLLHHRDSIGGRAAGEHRDDKGKIREGERLDRGDHRGVRDTVVDRLLSAGDGERVGRDALVLPRWCAVTAAWESAGRRERIVCVVQAAIRLQYSLVAVEGRLGNAWSWELGGTANADPSTHHPQTSPHERRPVRGPQS